MMLKRLASFVSALLISLSSLLVIYVPKVHALGLTCTWNRSGPGGQYTSVASNWDNCGGGVPGTGDTVVFDSTGKGGAFSYAVVWNDISSWQVDSIVVQGDVEGYNVSFDAVRQSADASHYGSLYVADSVVNTSSGSRISIMSGFSLGSGGSATVNAQGGDISLSEVSLGANNATMTGANVVTLVGTNGRPVTGSGTITYSGTGELYLWDYAFSNTGGFSGSWVINQGTLKINGNKGTALGSGSNVTVNGGAVMKFELDNANNTYADVTFANPITLNGTESSVSKISATGKTGEDYTVTLSGQVTLGANFTADLDNASLTLSSQVAGGYTLSAASGNNGTLTVPPSPSIVINGSTTATTNIPVTLTAVESTCTATSGAWIWSIDGGSGSSTSNTIDVTWSNTGAKNVTVTNSGCASATGTKTVTVSTGTGTPACISTDSLTVGSGATLDMDIGGANTVCAAADGYDQITSSGAVTLGGTLALNRLNSFAPAAGNSFTLINKTSNGAVSGTFSGLVEGATVTLGGVNMTISYLGGDGNDVVLTAPSPTPTITIIATNNPSGVWVTGATYTFDAASSNCSPSSPTTGWTWTAGSGTTSTSTTNSISITWTTTGSKTVHATNPACPGATVNDATPTITAAPTITVSGPATGVTGQSLAYTATAANCTPNATGWTWSVNGGTGSSTSNTINVSWATTGSKTVSVTNSGCSGATVTDETTSITAAPVPTVTASGPTSGIIGQSLAYTATAANCTPNATGWTWSVNGGTGSSTSNTINVSWATTGSKTVSATNSACADATATNATTSIAAGPTVVTDEEGNKTTTVSDAQDLSTVSYTVASKETLTNNGKLGDVTVQNGAVVKGSGTFGDLNVQSGGRLAPGNSPGCVTSTGLSLASGSSYDVEIAGTAACTEYDQAKVDGAVDITGANLNVQLISDFKPKKDDTFTIIENDAADVVTGTFAGLSEGATFTVNGYVFKISYAGGTGNDVVLTVQSVPATPNTGLSLLFSNPLVALMTTTTLAGALYAMGNKRRIMNQLTFGKK